LPSRLSELPPDAQEFVKDYLVPLLGKEERERLVKAEGQWPLFPKTLVELADKHPYKLPGRFRPSRADELPGEFRRQLMNKLGEAEKERLKQLEGKWPQFTIAVAAVAKKKDVPLPHQFGPTSPKDSKNLQRFVNVRLGPLLDRDERSRLKQAEGDWPLYPKTVFELASKHGMDVPGPHALIGLPGPPEQWNKYRLHPQGVADAELREPTR